MSMVDWFFENKIAWFIFEEVLDTQDIFFVYIREIFKTLKLYS
jgi:hypothetical protein